MAANVRASKVWYLDYFYLSGPCQAACPSQITVHLYLTGPGAHSTRLLLF